MVTVTMKHTTHDARYGALRVGQVLDVDDDIAAHWISNGIAERGKRKARQDDAPAETPEPADEPVAAAEPPATPRRVSTGESARGALGGRR